jgi:hypothetical protein
MPACYLPTWTPASRPIARPRGRVSRAQVAVVMALMRNQEAPCRDREEHFTDQGSNGSAPP